MEDSRLLSLFEWPEYLFYRLFRDTTKPEPVGASPVGARYGIWPIYFEEYRSNTEPLLHDTPPGPNRIAVWHRRTRMDVPRGWLQLPWLRSSIYIGYHKLAPGYFTRWSKTARYYRKKWRDELLDKKYRVISLSFDEFARAYSKSTVASEIPTYELKKLQARLERFPDSVQMWGAERIRDGVIVGGHAVFDGCKGRASAYSCGFYLKEERMDNVMLGLIDHWFADALSRHVEVLHFGAFVPPHESGTKRGKGISHFKAQFVTDYLLYQPPLFKFLRGTILRK